jgi:hypothetical protein
MDKKKATTPAKGLRSFLLFLLCTIAVGIVLLMAFSTKPVASAEDIRYINAFLKDWNISATPTEVHQSFESEIAFIRSVQDSIVSGIQHSEIQQNRFGDVRYYYENRSGFCYDRMILLEKIFLYFGFDIRHVFVYYPENNATAEEPRFSALFKKGTGSHALSEVKTRKGWMVLGSNADWIGLDLTDQPFTIKGLQNQLYKTGEVPLKRPPLYGICFWKSQPRFRYLYGVYSRHGRFFPPNTGIPDYNLRMLLYNLW